MKQKLRITFLTRLYHPHVGGVEKHLEVLSKMLVKKGYLITIITEKYDTKLKSLETYDGITVYRVPVSKNVFLKKFFVWVWICKNLSLIYNSDVVHVHDIFYWILPFRLLLIHKNIYTTFHGYEGFPISWRWVLQRKVIEKLSNGTICIGDFMKKWYKSNPAYVSYGGVKLASKIKAKNDQSAVFFGRLDDQTGILEYISAYKKIKDKFPNFSLTVVGEGKYVKKIPKEVRILKFTKNVEKYISDNRIVFVSRYLSMLEALVQKKEVVAVYDNPVKKDYLLMSPFRKYVYVAKNANQVEEQVLKILSDKTNKEKLEEGYLWARKNTWESVLDTYLRLWGINK